MKRLKNYKKSFALLFTIFLITTFSLLAVYILEIKTFQSDSKTKEFHQIQAKFHFDFTKKLIKNLDLNSQNDICMDTLTINNDHYSIFAHISYINSKNNCPNSKEIEFEQKYNNGVATIDLYVESKSSIFKVKLHERFLQKL